MLLSNCLSLPLSLMQFRIELTSALPVQVDGEAWMQTPSTIVVSLMPSQTRMLEKSRTSIVHSLSHREARDILARHGATAMNLSMLGSRHKGPGLLADEVQSPTSEGPHVSTTHTVYKKSDSLPQMDTVDHEARTASEVDVNSTAT